ncbi:hypothetical protein [Flavobacterium sp.]|jgi:hypothetical protein|uniref:hypothetical protein n=1 Tax=Flavobacterium sp. TaxID=239 RepID=UPI0034FA398F
MNKFLIIVALTLFLKPVFPVIDYLVNYKYISTVLCENKDKPKLNCCGKCHLKKELAKASEGEKPIQSNKKDNHKQEVENLFFQDLISLLNNKINTSNKPSLTNYYSNLYCYLNGNSEFHPPTFS